GAGTNPGPSTFGRIQRCLVLLGGADPWLQQPAPSRRYDTRGGRAMTYEQQRLVEKIDSHIDDTLGIIDQHQLLIALLLREGRASEVAGVKVQAFSWQCHLHSLRRCRVHAIYLPPESGRGP